MSLNFRCPECRAMFKGSDELAGRRVKCRKCEAEIRIPAKVRSVVSAHPKPKLPPAQPKAVSSFDDVPPMPVQTKQCPNCQAWIKMTAVKCRHCKVRFDKNGKLAEGQVRLRAPRERFQVGEVMRAAWAIYKEEWPTCLVVYLTVGFLVALAAVVPFFGMAIVGKMMMGTSSQPDPEPSIAKATLSAVMFFGYIVFVAGVAGYLNCGLMKFALRLAQGERAGVDDVLGVRQYFLTYLANLFVFGLAIGLGSVALVVPGLLAMFVLWPVYFTSVDDVGPGLQPLIRAYEVGKKNILPSAGLILLAFGVYVAGALMCGIGALFAVPFDLLMFAVAYCHMSEATRD